MTHALVSAVTLVLATGLVVLGATRAARAGGLTDPLDLLVTAPVVAAIQIIATLVFAGVVLERLELWVVLAANALVTGIIVVFLRPPRRRGRPGGLRATVARLAAACRAHPLVATLVALAALALSWRVVLALALPPYGFDALAYHLATVVDWLQMHRISTGTLNTCCAYYPQNGELLVTWPALLGRGVEYVDLVQIAFALLGAAAVAGIARAANLPPRGAVAAAAIFVLTPVVLAQANTAYVDVTFTSAGLAAFYLVLRYVQAAGRERWFLLGCAGAATGLCMGTKLTGIDFGLTLALPLVLWALARRKWTWTDAGLATALFGLPVAALGISWYLRSWIVTGNPFHPLNVKFLGITVFADRAYLGKPPPEIARHFNQLQPLISWKSDLHFWTKRGYLYGEQFGGLGPVWSYFGAVLVIVFAVYAWRRRRAVFWLFLVPTVLLFLIQPDHYLSRYTIGLAAAGSIAVAWAMTAAWEPAGLRGAFAVATVALAAAGAYVASHTVLAGGGFRALGPRHLLSDIVHGRHTVGTVFDRDYAWIDGLKAGAPIGVDVAGVHQITPLAGRRFQNRVILLPRTKNLCDFVARHGVAYVVTRAHSRYDLQAQGSPGCFIRLAGRRVHTYRVVGAGSSLRVRSVIPTSGESA